MRLEQRRGDRGGHAVAHRARGRRELRAAGVAQPRIAVEAMQPAAEVAGAVGEDRVLGQRGAAIVFTTSAMSSGATGVGCAVGLVVGAPRLAVHSAQRGDGGAASVASAGAAQAIDDCSSRSPA